MTSTFKTNIVHGAKPMASSKHKWWPLSTHVTVLACAIVLQQILLTTMIYMYLQSNDCSYGRLPNVLKGSIEAKRPKRYHPNNVFDKIYLLNLKADTKKLNVMYTRYTLHCSRCMSARPQKRSSDMRTVPISKCQRVAQHFLQILWFFQACPHH